MRSTTARRLAALVAGAGCLVASTAAANDVQPVLAFEHVGLSKMMPDARDRALRNAIAMIPHRVAELPVEIPGADREVIGLVNLMLATLSRPAHVALAYDPDDPVNGGMNYGLVVRVDVEGEADAERLHDTLSMVVAMSDVPQAPVVSGRFDSMMDIQTPVATVSYGPRQIDGEWRYEILVGAVSSPEAAFTTFASPTVDGQPVMRFKFDLAALNPAFAMVRPMIAQEAPPEFNTMVGILNDAGLMGPEAICIDAWSGFTEGGSITEASIENAPKLFNALRLADGHLLPSDLKAIPADARVAYVSRADFGFVDAMLDYATRFDAPVDQMLAEVEREIGIDLQEDFFHTIGGTMATYTAESTGGGGLASTVMLVSFKDRERFVQTHQRLQGMANGLASQMPLPGRYVSLDSWSHDGTDLVSLRFPGVPVPIEITYALTEDWLVVGATPQAAIAAAAQVNGQGDGGLLANPRFIEAAPRGRELYSISFVDPQDTFEDGYGFVSLLGSAVANLVRSPHGESREPGLLVPTYGELARGVKPTIQYSYWDDDTFRMVGTGDRSWLASMAVQVGSNPSSGGGMMPMIMQGFAASQQGRGGMNGWGMLDVLRNEAVASMPFGPVTPLISIMEAGRAAD